MADQRQGRGCANYAAIVLSLFAAVECALAASTYTVGDASGWGTGNDYRTWEQKHTFAVGDTIVFNYGPPHSVVQVSQADYQACNTNGPLKSYSSGKDTVTIKDPSSFFICGTPGHCQMGMKVAIITASSTPSTPINPPSGTGSTGTGSTKSPTATPNKANTVSLQSGSTSVILLSIVAAITTFLL
ncbi:hypothetical protein O6H91_01G016100 [Diphasiastrum complanatum]|uniref:Uncharacterized protein n=1 Tax=Diphasiastrum complanatum TaxID=34168 RepID=A0ACC2ENG4_DIPCM|nr:hypothetical protein O6H91_01G016100 [Diphasiastrum complanatum]